MVKVLIVCAHPGDEILGCGGTLARHVHAGDTVRVLVLGDGWTSRVRTAEKGLAALDLDALEDQARTGLRRLGIAEVRFRRLPDNRFDSMALLDVVKIVEDEARDFRPDLVYTNSPCDLSIDQRTTFQAVLTAFRPQPGQNRVSLYAFEVASSTEWNQIRDVSLFVPTRFVDIGATLAAKIEAYRAHESELRPWPHARSLQALEHQARSRGAAVGLEAAEAFMVVRQVATAPRA